MKNKILIVILCLLLVLLVVFLALNRQGASVAPDSAEQQSETVKAPGESDAKTPADSHEAEAGVDNEETVPVVEDTIDVVNDGTENPPEQDEEGAGDAIGDVTGSVTVEETEDGVEITVPEDMDIGGL